MEQSSLDVTRQLRLITSYAMTVSILTMPLTWHIILPGDAKLEENGQERTQYVNLVSLMASYIHSVHVTGRKLFTKYQIH